MATAASTASGSSEDLSGNYQMPEAPRGKLANRITGPLFPLGYKEGFNQWWASIPAAAAEHKVLSFIPYLQHPPTHKQTGKDAVTPNESTDSLTAADPSQAFQVSAKSIDDPHGPRIWRSTMVELSGNNRALNEFSIERVGEKTEQNLVILHGYGAGLGFFYKNFEALSRAKGWQLYALDMLGMGRSTRPPFKIHSKQRHKAISEAEDWFIDALEEWRIKRKLDKFTLLGHSLGGYMAVSYALKYPGRLNKLILASPVGIPEDPFAVSADMPEPSESTMGNEFTQDQNNITKPASANNNTPNKVNGESTPPRRPLPKWLKYLWDANVSPFSLVRWSGPLGPRLVSGWTSRRFSHLPPAEAQALHDYAYSLFRMRGSGEYALAYILAPGAFARNPLIKRIHAVGRQVLRPDDVDVDVKAAAAQTQKQTQTQKWCASKDTKDTPTSSQESSINSSTDIPQHPQPQSSSASTSSSTSTSTSTYPSSTNPSPPQPSTRERGIPIVLMYGEHDWMDVAGGYAAQARIEEEKARILRDASPEERAADKGSAKVVIIKNAGHHLYLDGWEEFNEVILEEMRGVDREAREVRREKGRM
ncbi:alpha/beta hydrolase [Blastomyces gilchristii SLH14081]|uniref:Alpha/beta hydrolase n=1 Tax=Blastomyces gilchristii (strain SLH14081) TaxID=559298 RepID=A0A179UGD7_BLAGS|nr:alpha/beta hydrolase [Blastomyces gilchristii SLH14081]OAT07105.1 alpha/beta hydrolase [Blastomyces gilchristii SLH14081]